MRADRLVLSLLTAQAFTTLVTVAFVVFGLVAIARQALHGTEPVQRAAILRAIAEIARALLSRRR